MQWVDRCFSSLRNSTVLNDVFVVDNGSTDGSQDYIKNNYPEVVFRQSESNLGFGKANNIGLEYALRNNYDYVYLLNQDAWVATDTFEKLIEIHSKHREFGIISPLQRNYSRKFDDNFYYTTLTNQIFFDQLFPENSVDIYETNFVMAAHWLISKDCLVKVGGFSPSFPHYGEDDNFIDRCKFHGFKIGVTFNTMAVHDREIRPYSLKNHMYMDYIRNLVAFSNPNGKAPSLLSILYTSIKNLIKLRTIDPVKYCYRIFRDRKEILRNCELSKRGSAFINI